MNLLTSYRSEMLKTKRSATFYLTLLAAAIIPIIFLLDLTFDGINSDSRKDPLNGIFKMGFEILTLAFLPVFVVALCTLLPQIEFRNNTWKQLHASPQTKANVFLAKFLQVHSLILLMLLSFNVFMWFVIIAANLISPALKLFDKPLDVSALITSNVNAYVAILAMSAVQFWLGLKFKNFIVPIAIGIALWIGGIMILVVFKITRADLFPYSYTAFTVHPEHRLKLGTIQLYSAGYTAIFLLLGFLHFKYKNVKA